MSLSLTGKGQQAFLFITTEKQKTLKRIEHIVSNKIRKPGKISSSFDFYKIENYRSFFKYKALN